MIKHFDDGQVTLWQGDMRELRCDDLGEGVFDCVVTDPPYGQTSLEWDRWVDGWPSVMAADFTESMWVFGSLRMFMKNVGEFTDAGWKLSQDIVWLKHNGSSFHADRFRRVHEQVAHFYLGEWRELYKEPPVTMDATKRTVRSKARPPHMGDIERKSYVSVDGGPRLMTTVRAVASEHGRAVHPTQKPTGILRPLIEYSCPPDGVVLDPFAGSGSTLIAARECGRRAVGVEVSAEYCAAAVRRLSQGVLAL